MLRYLLFLSALALFTSCAKSLPENSVSITPIPEAPYNVQYDRDALQNLKWITGDWKNKLKGKGTSFSFVFHTNQMLEVAQTEGSNTKPAQFFSWKDGHYYYGQNRQWIITWITEKNIRFDPVVPGLKPMTWSKVHDNEWHLIKHSDAGDEVIVMQRVDELPS